MPYERISSRQPENETEYLEDEKTQHKSAAKGKYGLIDTHRTTERERAKSQKSQFPLANWSVNEYY